MHHDDPAALHDRIRALERTLDEFELSRAITEVRSLPGQLTVQVRGQPAGASFGLQLDVIPTLAGTLQWGAATLALREAPEREVQVQPAALRVAP